MAIETTPSGTMVITGDHIHVARLITLKHGLKFEITNPSMRFTRVPLIRAAKGMGYDGPASKKKALEWVEDLLRQIEETGAAS